MRVVVPPGTILLHHYEISHRATGRKEEDAPWRCMFKLQFARCSEPAEPSWDCSSTANPFAESPSPSASTWDWMVGAEPAGGGNADVGALVEELNGETEAVRVRAAYELAYAATGGSATALDGLLNALQSTEVGREAPAPYQAGSKRVLPRVAMRGLAAAGSVATTPLISMLGHGNPTVVADAAFALGESAAPSLAVVEALHSAYGAFSASLDELAEQLDTSDLDALPYGGSSEYSNRRLGL